MCLFILLLIILHRNEIILVRLSESPMAPQASVIHHSLGLPILLTLCICITMLRHNVK